MSASVLQGTGEGCKVWFDLGAADPAGGDPIHQLRYEVELKATGSYVPIVL
jgi:hypothetical protein